MSTSDSPSCNLIPPCSIQSPRHNEKCLQYSYYWRLHTAANVWSHAIPLAVSHQPPTTEAWSNFRPAHIRFVVDKTALGKVYLPRTSIFPPVSLHPCFVHTHSRHQNSITSQQLTASINNTQNEKDTVWSLSLVIFLVSTVHLESGCQHFTENTAFYNNDRGRFLQNADTIFPLHNVKTRTNII